MMEREFPHWEVLGTHLLQGDASWVLPFSLLQVLNAHGRIFIFCNCRIFYSSFSRDPFFDLNAPDDDIDSALHTQPEGIGQVYLN